ncbi:MAG: hypothetical protein PHH63_02570, partial [Bacteroidales bacterium]|nr:hypothetical protein [Bacteroidales bacterium]
VWHVSSLKKNLLSDFCIHFCLLKGPFSYILIFLKRENDDPYLAGTEYVVVVGQSGGFQISLSQ